MKRKKVWAAVGLLVVVIVMLVTRDSSVPVKTFNVKVGPFTAYLEENGIIEAKDAREVQAAVAGRISTIRVAEGQQVRAGDILAVMDKGDLESEVQKSMALVKGAQSQLAGAVHGAGTSQLAQARAEVEAARTNLTDARRQAAQAETLLKSGAISNEEFQQKITLEKLQNSNLAIAEARLTMLQSGAGSSEREALQAQVEQAEAQLDTAIRQLSNAEIKAPVNGIVLRRYVEPGTYIQPGAAMFKIGSPGQLQVGADILESEAVKLRVSQRAIISGDVLADRTIAGEVTAVAPEAVVKVSSLGVEQRRVPVKIRLRETGLLKPGFNVDLRIVTGERTETLAVPEDAIFSEAGRDFVFVVEQGEARRRQVAAGLRNKEFVEITGGLKSGEWIIREPDNSLAEGTKVKDSSSTE